MKQVVSVKSFLEKTFLTLGAILIATPSAFAQEAPTPKACPDPGFRYAYADSANVVDKLVTIYGCKVISPDGKLASDCHKITVVDTRKLDEAQEKAKESLFSWVSGLAVGMACTLGIEVGKMFNKPMSLAMGVVDRRVGESTTSNIRDATLRGERQIGDSPDPKLVNKGVAGHICAATKAIPNEMYKKGVSQGMKDAGMVAAMPWAYKADAQAVWAQPTGGGRRAAFEAWQKKLKENADKEAYIIKQTAGVVGKVYRYLTTGETMGIPFGTSPVPFTPLKPDECITPENFREFARILKNFKDMAAESQKNLEDFEPYKEVILPLGEDTLQKQLKGLKLPETVSGVHEVVPGERPDSTFHHIP